MRPTSEIKGRVDAVILTIRDDEKNAVDKRVGPPDQYVGRRTYRVARLEGAGRTLTAALHRLPEQGTSPAQAAATDAIEDLDPTLIVLVGIAGAVPTAEFTLGDVLVATRIADLRIQALVPDRLPELSVRSDRIHAALAERISNLNPIELQEWASVASIAHSRPAVPLTPERFTAADQVWNKKVRESLEAHFHIPRVPRYRTAEIATTDFLVKDPVTVQHWLQAVRKIEGFEMEAAGVMAAATRTDALYPVLVVRGISDIVGYKRDSEWTAYACHSAAAFAIALLRSGQLEGISPLRVQPPLKADPQGGLVRSGRQNVTMPGGSNGRPDDGTAQGLSTPPNITERPVDYDRTPTVTEHQRLVDYDRTPIGTVLVEDALSVPQRVDGVLVSVRRGTGRARFALVHKQGDSGLDIRPYLLKSPHTLIGRGWRDPQVPQLELPHNSVSRNHAVIVATAKGAMVKDLESTNGTFVNGFEIGEFPIKVGDQIKFGDLIFAIRNVTHDGNDVSRQSTDDLKSPKPKATGFQWALIPKVTACAFGAIVIRRYDLLRATLSDTGKRRLEITLGRIVSRHLNPETYAFKQISELKDNLEIVVISQGDVRIKLLTSMIAGELEQWLATVALDYRVVWSTSSLDPTIAIQQALQSTSA